MQHTTPSCQNSLRHRAKHFNTLRPYWTALTFFDLLEIDPKPSNNDVNHDPLGPLHSPLTKRADITKSRAVYPGAERTSAGMCVTYTDLACHNRTWNVQLKSTKVCLIVKHLVIASSLPRNTCCYYHSVFLISLTPIIPKELQTNTRWAPAWWLARYHSCAGSPNLASVSQGHRRPSLSLEDVELKQTNLTWPLPILQTLKFWSHQSQSARSINLNQHVSSTCHFIQTIGFQCNHDHWADGFLLNVPHTARKPLCTWVSKRFQIISFACARPSPTWPPIWMMLFHCKWHARYV